MKMLAACGALMGVILSTHVSGQSPPAGSTGRRPAFEVASVRPSNPNPPDPMSGRPRLMPVGGRLTVANLPLRMLIRVAYDVQDLQVVGGPSDLLSRKFDITAKAEAGTGQTLREMAVLLRTLLSERFALVVRSESRDAPIYALVVARKDGALGPAMKVSTSDCAGLEDQVQRRLEMLAKEGAAAMLKALTAGPIPCAVTPAMAPATGASGFGLRGNGQPMESLVRILTPALGRTLRDETGLTGLYDWELHFDPQVFRQVGMQAGLSPALVAPPPSDSPSLMTALQEQLGLRLDARRGPVDHLIIEHVEAPTPD